MPSPDLLLEYSRKCAAKGRLFEAQIELTHRCNLRCVHCYVPPIGHPPEHDTLEWKGAIDRLVEMGLCVATFTGGEPLLHRGLPDLVAHAFSRGCQTRVFSNANLFRGAAHAREFKDAGLCYLETSIYGASAPVHDAITGVPGSFECTLAAVRWFKELGIAVTIKTSWMKQNWRDYPGIVALVRDLGVLFRGSPNLMPRLDGDTANLRNQMSFEDMVALYRMDGENAPPAEDCAPTAADLDKPPCGIARSSITLSSDGDAYPCLHVRRPYANIFRDDIRECWVNAPVLQELRAITRRSFTTCDGCETRAFCFVCLGDGWLEWKDVLRPSAATCLMGRARRVAKRLDHDRPD